MVVGQALHIRGFTSSLGGVCAYRGFVCGGGQVCIVVSVRVGVVYVQMRQVCVCTSEVCVCAGEGGVHVCTGGVWVCVYRRCGCVQVLWVCKCVYRCSCVCRCLCRCVWVTWVCCRCVYRWCVGVHVC